MVETYGVAIELIGIVPVGPAQRFFQSFVTDKRFVKVAKLSNVGVELQDKIQEGLAGDHFYDILQEPVGLEAIGAATPQYLESIGND